MRLTACLTNACVSQAFKVIGALGWSKTTSMNWGVLNHRRMKMEEILHLHDDRIQSGPVQEVRREVRSTQETLRVFAAKVKASTNYLMREVAILASGMGRMANANKTIVAVVASAMANAIITAMIIMITGRPATSESRVGCA